MLTDTEQSMLTAAGAVRMPDDAHFGGEIWSFHPRPIRRGYLFVGGKITDHYCLSNHTHAYERGADESVADFVRRYVDHQTAQEAPTDAR